MITYVALMTASEPTSTRRCHTDPGCLLVLAITTSHFYHPSNVPPQQCAFAYCGYSQVQSQSRNGGSYSLRYRTYLTLTTKVCTA